MTTSTVFGLPYLASQQATPEITHNEALYMIEAMLRGVKAIQNAPPGGPADGDTYIVGTAGSGAWLGKNNCVAVYMSNAWRFIPGFDTLGAQIAMGANQEGMSLWNIALDARYTWTGAAWSVASGVAASGVSNTPSGNIAATDVQGAINELDAEKIAIAGHAAVSVVARSANSVGAAADLAAGSDGQFLGRAGSALSFQAITGLLVSNTPAGNIAAVTVQAAINELDTEKAGLAAANVFTAAQTVNLNGGSLPTPPSGTMLHAGQANATTAGFVLDSFGSTPSIVGRRANGTNASKTQVTTDSNLLIVNGSGYGATGYGNNKAQIGLNAAENWSDSAQGTYVVFEVTPIGSTSRAEIARLASTGLAVGGNIAVDSSSLLRTRTYTVATLPAAGGVTGALARVSDALVAPVYNAIAAGGGVVFAQVTSDGTNWRYC